MTTENKISGGDGRDNKFLLSQLNESKRDLKFLEEQIKFTLDLAGYLQVQLEGQILDINRILKTDEEE
tara:strand:- start:629 stop:832 length:204 start_codon:yes stop_codon:yes gene_type:complete